MSFLQTVSNWLLGDYKVRTTKLADNSLIQHVHLVDTTGADVGGADGAIIDGASSSIKATVLDLADSNPLTVAITDANGDQITSFGGGTQYTEGDTDATITGTAMLWEDAANTLVTVNASKPLPVSVSGVATSAKQDTGNTSLASIDGKITACNTGAVVVSSGSITATQGTATNLKTQAESYQGGTAVSSSNPLQVTLANGTVPSHAVTIASGGVASGAIASGAIVAGAVAAGASSFVKLEDVASADADAGVPAMAVRKASPANTSNADGDYEMLQMAAGRLWTSGDVTFAGTAADVNSGNKGSGTLRVVIATDQPALTNKLLVTPDANSTVDLNKLAGNTISSGVGASGTGTLRVAIANDTGRTLVSKGGSASSSGDNTLVSAGTNKLKVFAFSLSTTSTTAVTCIFQSGASGTELWRCILQAPTSVSTGANLAVTPPAYLFATASATLLNLNLSGAQTVHWSVSYYDEA